MIASTPEQLRALANDADRLAGVALPACLADQHPAAVAAALRTAADQLEELLTAITTPRAAAADQLEALPTREQIERTVVNYGYDRAFTVHGNCIDVIDLTAYGKHVAEALLAASAPPREDCDEETKRLRAVIEKAPHDPVTCKWWWSRNTVEPMSCNCWKADTL